MTIQILDGAHVGPKFRQRWPLIVAGVKRQAWTGGDVPRRGLCLADSRFGRRYRLLRRAYFRKDLMANAEYWGGELTRDVVKTVWNRASLDAFATSASIARSLKAQTIGG